MRLRGSNIRVNSLLGLPMLAMLSGIVLLIYTLLRKKNLSDTGLHIYALVKSYGFTDTVAKFVTSQAAHETAVAGIPFMSKIFNSNNNAFGMKWAGQSSADGEKNGYAYYTSVDRSVYDYARWWVRHRSGITFPLLISSLDSFVKFLKNQNYFEAPEAEYLKGCNYFYKLMFG
jgi:Uncharacterized FlgJ-related protein